MDPAVFVKLICDMAMWFCIAGVLFPEPCSGGAMAVIAGLCVICGTLGALIAQKHGKLRLLAAVPLLAAAFFINSVEGALAFIPPCAYVACMTALDRFNFSRYEFEAQLKPVCLLLPVYMIAASIFGAGERVLASALPLYMIFAVCGFILLRMLRHDEGVRREPRFIALNTAAPILICALAALLSYPPVLSAIGSAVSYIYDNVMSPILMLFAYACYGVVWVLEKLIRPLLEKQLEDAEPFELNLADGIKEELTEGMDEAGANETFEAIFRALMILAFIVIAILIFRRLLGDRRRRAEATGERDMRSAIAPDSSRPAVRSIFRPRTPRELVRFYYARFMKRLTAVGIDIPIYYTTEMISAAALADFPAEPMRELRAIYLRARYSEDDITREDARRARELLDALKKPRKAKA